MSENSSKSQDSLFSNRNDKKSSKSLDFRSWNQQMFDIFAWKNGLKPIIDHQKKLAATFSSISWPIHPLMVAALDDTKQNKQL